MKKLITVSLFIILLVGMNTAGLFAASKGEVVINEVGWAGTLASSSDEWIELYNSSSSAIDLTGWEITGSGLDVDGLSGSISANEYYLIENDEDVVSDVDGDNLDSSISLSNSGETLILRDDSDNEIDQVDCSAGWFNTRTSTDTPSMERITPTRLGNDPDNWADVSSDTNTWNGHDADDRILAGSPKQQNTIYADDITNPAAITDLTALTGAVEGEINLKWTAPGTDGTKGYCGYLSTYTVKYATFPVDDLGGDTTAWWTDTNTSLYTQSWDVSPQGTLEEFTVEGLTPGDTYYFAVKTTDGAGNTSVIDQRTKDSNQDKAYSSTNVDNIAPGSVTDLAAQQGTNPKEVELTWIAPGDDGYTEDNVALSTYTVKYATFSITDLSNDTTDWWQKATIYSQDWSVSAQGTAEVHIATMPFAGTTYYFAVKTTDEGGNTSTIDDNADNGAAQATAQSVDYSRTVVINEIAWMGTDASYADEWIELYNNTGGVIDFTLNSGWTIETEDGLDVSLTESISSEGYYIIEDSTETIFDLTEDQQEGISLNNDDEKLVLKDGNGVIIDQVDCTEERIVSGDWYAGNNDTKTSMERIKTTVTGDSASNWATATSTNGHVDDGGNIINGTPAARNSVWKSNPDTARPGPVTDLVASSTPTAEGLMLNWTAPSDDYDATVDNSGGYYYVKYATWSMADLGNDTTAWWNSILNSDRDRYKGTWSTDNPKNVGNTELRLLDNLYPYTAYYVAVRVYDEEDNESYLVGGSTSMGYVKTNFTPAAPEWIVTEPVVRSSGEIELDWKDNSELDLAGYIIYRASGTDQSKANNTANRRKIDTIGDNSSYNDSSVENEKYYSYWLKAYDNFNSTSNFSGMQESPSSDIDAPEIKEVYPGIFKAQSSRVMAFDKLIVRVRVPDEDVASVKLEWRTNPAGSSGSINFEEESKNIDGVEYTHKCVIKISDISSTNGFDAKIIAQDQMENQRKYPGDYEAYEWLKIRPPEENEPEQKFITPSNPEVVFGKDVNKVMITDVRGNEVFSKSKGSDNFIIWNPDENGSVKLESGLYIYQIDTDEGMKYGSIVIAK